MLDLGIKPHLAVPDNAPASSPARRFVGSKGYKVSQVIRKRVEEIFGWGKSVAGLRRTKLKGRRRTWDGKGGCKGADNDCKGKNGCKGKGWTNMSEKKCTDKGGTVAPEPEKK